MGLCVAVAVELDRLSAGRRRRSPVASPHSFCSWRFGAARGSFQWTGFDTGTSPYWNGVPYVPILLATAAAALVFVYGRRGRRTARVAPSWRCSSPSSSHCSARRPWPLRRGGRTPRTAARQALSSVVARRPAGWRGVRTPDPGSLRPLGAITADRRNADAKRVRGRERRAAADDSRGSGYLTAHRPGGQGGSLAGRSRWSPGAGRRRRAFGRSRRGSSPSTPSPRGSRHRATSWWRAAPFHRDRSGPTSVRVDRNPRDRRPSPSPSAARLFDWRPSKGSCSPVTRSGTRLSSYLFEAFPCATLPPLRYGVARRAGLVVERRRAGPRDHGAASPFGASGTC